MKFVKVDKITESLELKKSIESVGLIRLNQLKSTQVIIKSSQQKIYYMCTLLSIISVVYILRDQQQNYLFSLIMC